MEPTQRNASPGFTPMAFRISASGQKPVNADCSRLAPTKAVNQSQLGECQCASASDARMKTPANRMTRLSTFI